MTDTKRRAATLGEALVLVGLWSGGAVQLQGAFRQVRELTPLPPPVRID